MGRRLTKISGQPLCDLPNSLSCLCDLLLGVLLEVFLSLVSLFSFLGCENVPGTFFLPFALLAGAVFLPACIVQMTILEGKPSHIYATRFDDVHRSKLRAVRSGECVSPVVLSRDTDSSLVAGLDSHGLQFNLTLTEVC